MKRDGRPSVDLAFCKQAGCRTLIWTQGGPRGKRYCAEHRYAQSLKQKKPPPPEGSGGS